MTSFDIIVVGGGHAGCEAAAVSARLGAQTALVTMRYADLGVMSCNPAIGGLGKGHLVREVDAWDGLIGRAADEAGIHYRLLNRSKGPAVHGPRVQADRRRYRSAIRGAIERQAGLSVIGGEAAALDLDAGGVIRGLVLADGRTLRAAAVVLATGTFLNGKLHFGMSAEAGGRIGERASTALATQLRRHGVPIARLKTGTPPRLDARTIDWAALDRQTSDAEVWTMSPLSAGRPVPQLFCGVTRTNAATHAIVRGALDRSPLFAGKIEGVGPRYCPSIEDKIFRFGDRDGHQIFLEPEALDDATIYPNGISTSLPPDVQREMVRSIAGLARAEIVQPGYAVEYDHVDPRSLDRSLALRAIPGLYLAGQINGTTGYEEAAAQGLVAGIGAARYAGGGPPIQFGRAESYIGVMIDDLTLQGVTEPYRMLTARAEYRLRLRSDNASTRLTPQAMAAGCIGHERSIWFADQARQRAAVQAALTEPVTAEQACQAGIAADAGPARPLSAWLASVPPMSLDAERLKKITPLLAAIDPGVIREVMVDVHYAPYVARQEQEVDRLAKDEAIAIALELDYATVPGLSAEMVERLDSARPDSLAAASRIRGITPAALAAVLVHARRAA